MEGEPIEPHAATADVDRLLARLAAAEAERDHARAEAEAAGRRSDELLSAVGHELRNPLNVLLGWVGLLTLEQLPPEAVREGLAAIERSAKAQARLLADLLDSSRVLAVRVELDVAAIDLAEVVAEAVAAVRLRAEANGVLVELAVGPGRRPVLGDAARLEQVARHLLDNAVKFSPDGGRVVARVEYPAGGPVLTVADAGHGIAAWRLPHLFDRDRPTDLTAPKAAGGLGLGLAVVRRLVELHGGTVAAASDGPGRGATFTVALPGTAGVGGARS